MRRVTGSRPSLHEPPFVQFSSAFSAARFSNFGNFDLMFLIAVSLFYSSSNGRTRCRRLVMEGEREMHRNWMGLYAPIGSSFGEFIDDGSDGNRGEKLLSNLSQTGLELVRL